MRDNENIVIGGGKISCRDLDVGRKGIPHYKSTFMYDYYIAPGRSRGRHGRGRKHTPF